MGEQGTGVFREARGRSRQQVWAVTMSREDQTRATTPPRAEAVLGVIQRATTPPRGGGAPPPVAPRPTPQHAGFGGDMPIVIGTVVHSDWQSPSSRTRLSRAGDEVSDAGVEFNSLQFMRQPRPSDVVLAEPFPDVRICGKYVPRRRVVYGTGCIFLLALCAVFVGSAVTRGTEDSEDSSSPLPDSWSYEDTPSAVVIPTSSTHVELQLQADISAMPEGSPERRDFETAVIDSAAGLMGIPKQRIAILEIREGNGGRRRQLQSGSFVIIVLGIVPAAENERTASAAVAALAAAVTMRSDELSGVLRGARITATGNMLGEVGSLQLSQAPPCSRSERPDVRKLATPSWYCRLHTLARTAFCRTHK